MRHTRLGYAITGLLIAGAMVSLGILLIALVLFIGMAALAGI
jgi:hypothetical protein